MSRTPRILLIGGTSHTGKSTLARGLAKRLEADVLATDYLARHPGRPWSAPPERAGLVTDHYRDHSVPGLMRSVLEHYDRVGAELLAPGLRARSSQQPLVVSGSAVLPARVAQLELPDAAAIWLVASEDLLRTRIHADSGYAGLGPEIQVAVD